ncbi:putative Protein farnesyltransferase subunit beta [Paratrimastix pyriformis]|uniref:Protein farnesyltransferase subunit beta n=1 Tax=Paratrimastix pyriformis TaxID=342808 RepID=A0ABQ8UG70_9EUKA|nr:putative Protein farnesyltransferase subunit beta [Paratrimastix pyriformis]
MEEIPESSSTLQKQTKLENLCKRAILNSRQENQGFLEVILRKKHIQYLLTGIRSLPSSFGSLDASRPWICYWILHGLEVLEGLPPASDPLYHDIVQFLARCQHPQGGFGGGPGQVPHLAPTYAAVSALSIIGTDEALGIIDRTRLRDFLYAMRTPEGAFRMQADGEVDVRGVYCAIDVASICGLMEPELVRGTADWILRCQTYEGGFGGAPGNEAHGGYTFCGVAGLCLLAGLCGCDDPNLVCGSHPEVDPFGGMSTLDIDALMGWLSRRQQTIEGGFSGRTNKLVDACYSFWQGGAAVVTTLLYRLLMSIPAWRDRVLMVDVPPLVMSAESAALSAERVAAGKEEARRRTEEGAVEAGRCQGEWLFDQRCLAEYIVRCCQSATGGVADKPEVPRDYYHTNYGLSGLALTQHCSETGVCLGRFRRSVDQTPGGKVNNHEDADAESEGWEEEEEVSGARNPEDLFMLHAVDPVFGLAPEKVDRAKAFFKAMPALPPRRV